MHIFLVGLSWFSLIFIIPAAICSFSASYNDLVYPGMTNAGFGYFVAMCFGIVAILLAMVGGLISRPRFFWIACLIVGVVYIVSCYGWFLVLADGRWIPEVGVPRAMFSTFLVLLPGILFITEGLILRSKRKPQQV